MTASPLNYTEMTKGSRIHGSLYCDPGVFERELDAIWYKVWVYIGHESEIPAPGDYVRRQVGLQPVIMIRGDDGGIGVFYNRCRHRGNLVCHRDRGNAADHRLSLSRLDLCPLGRAAGADLRGRL